MQTLDSLIEELARELCRDQGIDPDERVSHGYLDGMTDRERAEWGKSHRGVPLVGVMSPCWRIYRASAARIVAHYKLMKKFGEKINAQIEQETGSEA